MALVLATLQSELLARVFQSYGSDPAEGWSQAYGNFAATAQGCGTPANPAAILVGKANLKAGLVAAFQGIDPASTVAAMQTAFQAFWVGFTFTGAVVAIPGAPTLAAARAAQWASNPLLSDPVIAANLHAATLYAWSFTVTTGTPCFAPIV